MNKISEDEATEKLKRLVARCKECKFATCENCEINWNEVQAIETILDLYNKEKEKNKELEEKLKMSIAMLTKGTYPETEKGANDFDNYYISKDKIKEKIESIENMLEVEVCDEGINYRLKIEDKAKIKVLKELLEEKK